MPSGPHCTSRQRISDLNLPFKKLYTSGLASQAQIEMAGGGAIVMGRERAWARTCGVVGRPHGRSASGEVLFDVLGSTFHGPRADTSGAGGVRRMFWGLR